MSLHGLWLLQIDLFRAGYCFIFGAYWLRFWAKWDAERFEQLGVEWLKEKGFRDRYRIPGEMLYANEAWFAGSFRGYKNELPEAPEFELPEATEMHGRLKKEVGASGRPADYAEGLRWQEPDGGSSDSVAFCGCCAGPFLRGRQSGMCSAQGPDYSQKPVDLCAVCVAEIGGKTGSGYDVIGQRLARRHKGSGPEYIAIRRIALFQTRHWRAGAVICRPGVTAFEREQILTALDRSRLSL